MRNIVDEETFDFSGITRLFWNHTGKNLKTHNQALEMTWRYREVGQTPGYTRKSKHLIYLLFLCQRVWRTDFGFHPFALPGGACRHVYAFVVLWGWKVFLGDSRRNVGRGEEGKSEVIASCLPFTGSQEVLKREPCLSSPLLFNLHRSLASERCSANRTK